MAPTRIVVGYGRFGQTVAQMLIASDVPVTLIDNDTEMIDVAGTVRRQGQFR
jgi:glutathione-regulated potassium-efflux system protein KefB